MHVGDMEITVETVIVSELFIILRLQCWWPGGIIFKLILQLPGETLAMAALTMALAMATAMAMTMALAIINLVGSRNVYSYSSVSVQDS